MYPIFLGLHNLVRWVAVAAGVWALFRFVRGWQLRSSWTDGDATAARAVVSALDLQFLLGLLLYVVISPLTRNAFGDMSAAMADPAVRYFVVEHPTMMLIPIVVAHVGAARTRRASADARFRTAAIWFGIAVAALLAFMPWTRPLIPSF